MPVRLQAELLGKVAAYDRNLPGRAGDTVLVLLVQKAGRAESERSTSQIESALSELGPIAGRPHRQERIAWKGAPDLVTVIRARHAAIVYLSPGFTDEVPAIAAAMRGVDVLTAAAVPGYVKDGVVLGFDVQSGKPKLVVNLGQAREQHVAFEPAFLRLAEVVNR